MYFYHMKLTSTRLFDAAKIDMMNLMHFLPVAATAHPANAMNTPKMSAFNFMYYKKNP